MKQGSFFDHGSGFDREPDPALPDPAAGEPAAAERAATEPVEAKSERAAGAGAEAATSGDSEDRRVAVMEFERPILLEAGAGTGKTATLVARVLQWCLGPGWDRAQEQSPAAVAADVATTVLGQTAAITFTEAAAAEMSTRVGQALARVERVAGAGSLEPGALPLGLVLDELAGA